MRFPDITATEIVHEARDERTFKHSWKADISARDFKVIAFRPIDDRPSEDFAPDDANWGEQDSLANVPRAKQPAWMRAMALDAKSQGDR